MERKKSVAIIGTRGYPSYYGGFETAVRHIAPYLANSGWDVTVYGRAFAREQPDQGDPRINVRHTRGIESKSLSTLTYGLTASLDVASKKKSSVALVMNVANGYFLPLLKARGIPTLVNVDGIEWDRAKWGRGAKLVFHTGAKLTARYGTELVYDAEAIATRWGAEFGRSGIFIPYGGTPHSSPVPPLGLISGSYVLLVARFVPENTVPEFLVAAQQLAQRHTVIIVGSSGYGGALDAAASDLERLHENVRWLGHVSDDDLLFSLLNHAGVYFHGHSVGGTNPALVQAMACAAPVVARDTVYNREVLGERGTFVSREPTHIAAAIERMMANPEERRVAQENSRRRSADVYTWDSVCERYEQALTNLFEL